MGVLRTFHLRFRSTRCNSFLIHVRRYFVRNYSPDLGKFKTYKFSSFEGHPTFSDLTRDSEVL